MAQSAIQSWHRPEAGAASFSLGGEAIAIERAEVDRLVRALRQSELVPAASICEEISARALTGRVELCPTEAELEVLVSTLERLRGISDEGSALKRLLTLGRALRDQPGAAAAGGRPVRAVPETGERRPVSDRREDRP